jgi:pimeloyl-ACP methyl ester carboxylesterase
VYGLPIFDDGALLPYYSSHGSIVQEDPYRSQIETALVIIHGGGRNADDYFCSGLAAIGLQKQYKSSSVLLVAPRFLTAADGQVRLHGGGDGREMRWGGKGHGQWRYGAATVHPRSAVKNITSFEAIDVLMNSLGDRKKFPNMKRIVITGHSVGGQFVQRWSLLTSSWVENRTSAVIMNPSSWTYLTPMRWSKGKWQIPGDGSCSGYNHWTWGLEQHPTMMHSPYKDQIQERLGVGGLVDRFADRRVTYLAGSADRCNVTGQGQWCQSHDLGTACMDELQGSSRLDRHFLYVESLKLVGIETHEHIIVEGVGHDHALMFTSSVALSFLFPSDDRSSGPEIRNPGVLTRLLHLSAPFFRASVTRWSIYILCNKF